RGWTGAVLEAFEPAVELGGGQMESAGQSRRLEARRDFFHLADPAPRLARLHGDDLGPLRKLGLRALPFLEQRRFDPFVRRERAPATGGGPMMPPSTNVASAASSTRPMSRTVPGETAFASI